MLAYLAAGIDVCSLGAIAVNLADLVDNIIKGVQGLVTIGRNMNHHNLLRLGARIVKDLVQDFLQRQARLVRSGAHPDFALTNRVSVSAGDRSTGVGITCLKEHRRRSMRRMPKVQAEPGEMKPIEREMKGYRL